MSPALAGDPGAPEPDGAQIADWIAGYAADKLAVDVLVLDLHGVIGYTDYFVICSGNTDRQAKAIHDGIHLGMKQDHGMLPRRVEGLSETRWVLMDYLDVIVHVFTPEARDYYRLEQLWGEAPRRAVGEPNVEGRAGAFSGAEGARTPDLVAASHALSQLSYSPIGKAAVYRGANLRAHEHGAPL